MFPVRRRTPESPAAARCACIAAKPSNPFPPPGRQETASTHGPSIVVASVPSLTSVMAQSCRSGPQRSTTAKTPPTPPCPRAPDSIPCSAAPPTNEPRPTGKNRIAPATHAPKSSAARSNRPRIVRGPAVACAPAPHPSSEQQSNGCDSTSCNTPRAKARSAGNADAVTRDRRPDPRRPPKSIAVRCRAA